MTYVSCVMASLALTVFFGLSLFEARQSKREQLGVDYKPRYDYYYFYGWVLISAATSVMVSSNLGGVA